MKFFETDFSIVAALVVGFLGLCFCLKSCVDRQNEQELKAPIVETCVKHNALQRVQVVGR